MQNDGAPRMNEGLKITDKDKLGFRAALGGSGTVGTAGRSSAQLIVGAHRPREASTGGSLTPVTALKSSIVLTNPHKPASETTDITASAAQSDEPCLHVGKKVYSQT